jgi:hypothetical protein
VLRPFTIVLLSSLTLRACSDAESQENDDASAVASAVASSAPATPSASASAAMPLLKSPTRCSEDARVHLFFSPEAPIAGQRVRVIATTREAVEGALALFGADATLLASSGARQGGPPYAWVVETTATASSMRAALAMKIDGKETVACVERATLEAAAPPTWTPFGAARLAWDEASEDLYSAWIEHLFDAPLSEQPSWNALHEVLRDPARNFLHDHLGQGEDDADRARPIVIDPDCADLPYFLRAYFAHKLGLPFAWSSCTRGNGGQAPRCLRLHSMAEAAPARSTTPDGFGEFLRVSVANGVHSGNGRTRGDDDVTDYYPVKLSWEALRPGTIYADPYGHVLVVAKRIAQTETSGGVLLAVDGQPDATVARKRFWRGNFLFSQDPAVGGPGFKRFRPIVMERGRVRALTNEEITARSDYGDFSLEQYEGSVDSFYDRMDDVLSPSPLEPKRALLETIQALEEQVKVRVQSVSNGQKYLASNGPLIEMPKGSAIFETTGGWEDFSTPSRDLRLLIAIDIVKGFVDHVARRPERYAMEKGTSLEATKATLTATLTEELAKRRVAYVRTDGSSFELSLAEVLARAEALEMAYNPNDCVEARWGAPEGSDEASTCKRRAPPGQQARMRRSRPWFHERKRPARD